MTLAEAIECTRERIAAAFKPRAKIKVTYRRMTDEEVARFDKAFASMDKAFAEMDLAFKAMR